MLKLLIIRSEMKVKPNFELHHNLYIIALTEKKYMNKTNNKKTCTVYKGAHGGCGRKFEHFGRITRWRKKVCCLVQSSRQFHFIVKT